MEYGQTSKELEEEYEEETEPPRHYRNSLLPHFRFGVKLPDSMAGMKERGFGFNIPDTGNMVPVKIHDSTPWKTKIPKSGRRY